MNMKNAYYPGTLPYNAQVHISYRRKGQKSEDYIPIEESGLDLKGTMDGGDGSPVSPFVWRLSIINNLDEKWEGILRVDIEVPSSNARLFMPAFLYGRNKGGEEWRPGYGLFPRLREGEADIPYSPYWMVRSDRLSHPVNMMYVDSTIFGISASPYFIIKDEKVIPWLPGDCGDFHAYNGFCCSVANGASVGFTLGYENAPVLYLIAGNIKEREIPGSNCITFEPHSKLEIPVYIYAYGVQDEREINGAVRNTYERFHQSPRKGARLLEGIEDIALAIFKDSYDHDIKNYSTQVYLKEGRLTKNPLASISWTGGVEVATPLLTAALRLGREDMRSQALECIQNIVDNSINKNSGLPFDAFDKGCWTTKGWWDENLPMSGHSSYLVGQALFYILKAYDFERKYKGVLHEDWLEFAEKVITRIEKTKNSEKEYPYLWSAENGEGIDYNAFSGCWCLASRAYLAQIRKDASLIAGCIESEEHYFDKYVKHMECYGTPHDTWKAADSEGALAYIKAVRLLHEETGDGKYLERLKYGLEYEFTFKFCYNSPIQVPPLGRLGWSSSGGSVTSVCNPHIHPMSSNILDELLYCYKLTGDAYIGERFRDTLEWGLQTYSRFDNEYDYGKKGWMSERFCHSEGLLVEKYPDGSPSSTWFCFLPWGAANILEGMCGSVFDMIGK
jgi:hypothetical protein